jgi:hypothetical protein
MQTPGEASQPALASGRGLAGRGLASGSPNHIHEMGNWELASDRK